MLGEKLVPVPKVARMKKEQAWEAVRHSPRVTQVVSGIIWLMRRHTNPKGVATLCRVLFWALHECSGLLQLVNSFTAIAVIPQMTT
jgi:hypothetical protein